MVGSNEPFFDLLVRDLARGGSRRDFVRRSTGLAAVFGLARAGLPASWGRPVAALFGVPVACETDSDCGDPCLVCGLRATGEPKSCILKCQASCSECRSGQCVDICPACEKCVLISRPDGTCQPVEAFECITCDRETGKQANRCSACERCEKGECVSNCPNRCETCDNGTCRKCDRACEYCNELGRCYGCDSECQRCNPTTEECETTCDRGLVCCAGKCPNCCGSCDGNTCCADDAKVPACCGPTCSDLDSDDHNCGACYNLCRNQELCNQGKCVCPGVLESGGGFLAIRGGGMECRKENHECCDTECMDMARYQSDPKHCGKCIVECEKDERCVEGACVGSKRRGYSLVYVHRVTSEKLGVETSLTMKAVVRRLATPDAEGNTFAGKGSYEGSFHVHKVNCDNDTPMDSETIPLVGRAKGGAIADNLGGGQISLVFTITPLDPPKMHVLTRSFRALEQLGGLKEEEMPDLVLPIVRNLVLKGGLGQDSQTFTMWGGSCSGTLTHLMEWSATRIE